MLENRNRAGGRLRAAIALFGLGLPGILSLWPALPQIPDVPRPALLINPLIFLALAASLGAALALRCGFRSRLAARLAGADISLLPISTLALLLCGAVMGAAVTVADHALAPLWQQAASFPPSLVEAWSPAALLLGVFYGGVVEEIVMRWGLMSLLAWSLWRIVAGRAARPPEAIVFAALTGAAAVFAVSHLPALIAAGAAMTPQLVVRTVGFNFALGLAFGWLFAQRDLESAMLAHVGFHLGVALIAAPLRFVL